MRRRPAFKVFFFAQVALLWGAFSQQAGQSGAEPPAEEAASRANAQKDVRTSVAARGRIEPRDRIAKIVGSSQLGSLTGVIRELYVAEGDRVESGQVLGVYDTYALRAATVERLKAQLRYAELKSGRIDRLYDSHVAAADERDDWTHKVEVIKARLKEAEAALDLARIRAPFAGQVIQIHTYPGEGVGPDGVLELAKTDQMYAVAEVFENDIGWVRKGQRAVVTSPALPAPLAGTVERIGHKVGKLDALADDPAAKVDARVVEVFVRLDESEPVAGLTNLQVEVLIDTSAAIAERPGSPLH
ncbi:MAG: hypothetical protein KatS3mg077_0364 [Candidatus Binatia bacterium]|nr:MAG: hypothetical protein KatS3mg077_0364 [Candidatus Binatia bacterium]